jgi:poly(hydroxyalkanoate) granule-associated protein
MDPKLKQAVRPDEQAMLDAVCGSAQQIWQAGLGAFARAQQEGGDLFAKLVQDGLELQKITQRLAGEKGFSVTDTVTRLAENASRQASGSWDKLEKVFEDRVSRSLRAIGAPSAEEVHALSREVTELKTALRMAGERSEHDIDALRDALSRAVAELRAAIGSTGKKPAVAVKASTPARPAAKAAAKAPAKVAAKVRTKAAPKVTAKVAAKGTAAKRAPAKKTARSASRPA